MAAKYPLREMYNCAHREVGFRTRCYPRFVMEGRMKQGEADKELHLMTQIEAYLFEQYRNDQQLPLFDELPVVRKEVSK